jgi:hypothetical protein
MINVMSSNIANINSMARPYSIFCLINNTEHIPKKMYRKITELVSISGNWDCCYDSREVFERKDSLMQITTLLSKFIAGVIAGGVLSTAIAMVTQRSFNQYGVIAGLLVAMLCLVLAYWATTAGQVWCILFLVSIIPWLVVTLLSPELVALPGRYLDYAWLFPRYDTAAINNLEQWITVVAIPLAVLSGIGGWWSWGK